MTDFDFDFFEHWKMCTKIFFENMGYKQLDIILPTDTLVSELPISNRLKNLLIKNSITNLKHIEIIGNRLSEIKGMGMVLSKEIEKFKYQYKIGKINQ